MSKMVITDSEYYKGRQRTRSFTSIYLKMFEKLKKKIPMTSPVTKNNMSISFHFLKTKIPTFVNLCSMTLEKVVMERAVSSGRETKGPETTFKK